MFRRKYGLCIMLSGLFIHGLWDSPPGKLRCNLRPFAKKDRRERFIVGIKDGRTLSIRLIFNLVRNLNKMLAIYLPFLMTFVVLCPFVRSKYCIRKKNSQLWCHLSIFGQMLRSSSQCSVPLCASANNTNTSCAGSQQNCYAYTVALSNQTFCAPAASCSLFEACTEELVCSSNVSICLSNTCCPQPICVPISLAVINCGSSKWI